MKNQVRNLVRGAVLASLVVSAFGANARGGVGDGGGNILPESGMGPAKIEENIQKGKTAARFALFRLEFVMSTIQEDANTSRETYDMFVNLGKKLFSGPKTIYQALNEAKFKPIAYGKCQSVRGEEDASANPETSEICFSLQELQKKVTVTSGNGALLALIIHEVSHLVGATEDEAVTLQNMVQGSISNSEGVTIFEYASNEKANYDEGLKDRISSAESALSFAKAGNSVGVCTILPTVMSGLMNTTTHLSEQISNAGIAVASPSDWGVWTTAMLKSSYAVEYCYNQMGATDVIADYKKTFGGKDQIDFPDGILVSRFDKNPSPRPTLRNVITGGLPALKSELSDILAMLKTLQKHANQ